MKSDAHKAREAEASARWRTKHPDRWKSTYTKSNKKLMRSRRGLPTPHYPEPLVCEICNLPNEKNMQLCLDHDHTTNAHRGWLCRNCNLAVGLMKDSAERLRAAAAYLER